MDATEEGECHKPLSYHRRHYSRSLKAHGLLLPGIWKLARDSSKQIESYLLSYHCESRSREPWHCQQQSRDLPGRHVKAQAPATTGWTTIPSKSHREVPCLDTDSYTLGIEVWIRILLAGSRDNYFEPKFEVRDQNARDRCMKSWNI